MILLLSLQSDWLHDVTVYPLKPEKQMSSSTSQHYLIQIRIMCNVMCTEENDAIFKSAYLNLISVDYELLVSWNIINSYVRLTWEGLMLINVS